MPVRASEPTEPASFEAVMLTTFRAMAVPHTLVTLYFIVSVPAATPVASPELLMVANDVELLLHVPPDTVLVYVVAAPTASVAAPEITPADSVLTETALVVDAVPQLLVMK